MSDIEATIIQLEKAGGSSRLHSKQLDPFDKMYERDNLIQPPYDLSALAEMPSLSSALSECIEAMVQNIEGFGYSLECIIKEDGGLSKEIQEEKGKLESFFRYCSLDDSYIEIKRKTRRDLETFGFGAWEIIRDAEYNVVGIEHVPAKTLRIKKKDKKIYERSVTRWNKISSDRVEEEIFQTVKRYRRFCQVVSHGASSEKRWFKELGDLRIIDCETGKVISEDVNDISSVPFEQQATEILWFNLPTSTNNPYGQPRWIAELLSISGSRAAAEINYETINNNMIPSLAFLVSGGGRLSKDTIRRIRDFAKEQGEDSRNRSSILVLHAESGSKALTGDVGANVKISMERLREMQREDMMFLKYMEFNDEKIRRAFRLPPLFVGKTEAYNKATAEISRTIAEEQVFVPERNALDWKLNNLLLPELQIKYHTIKSLGGDVTLDVDLIRLLTAAEKTGGLTPDISRKILTEITGMDFGAVNEEKLDPNVPFSMQLSGITPVQMSMDYSEPEDLVDKLLDLRERLQEQLKNKIIK